MELKLNLYALIRPIFCAMYKRMYDELFLRHSIR